MAAPLTGHAYNAEFDSNRIPTITAISGTAGTADTSGTSEIIRLAANPVTGAMYVHLSGTDVVVGGTYVNITTGTQQTLGTVQNLNNGSVILQSGTLTTGTLQNLVSGTITRITAGTIDTREIRSNSVSSSAFSSLGTGGSAVFTSNGGGALVGINGTWVGTISFYVNSNGVLFPSNIVTPTGSILGSVSSNQSGYIDTTSGIAFVAQITSYTSGTPSFVANYGTPAYSAPITILGNSIPEGTNSIGAITINSKPGSQILTYGTSTIGTIGTLVAAGGAGTSIYVTSFSIDGDVTAIGTPDIVLGFGTVQNGSGVIFRGALPTTTPFGQTFPFPISNNQTNTPLTFMQLSGGGTIAFNVSYFVQ